MSNQNDKEIIKLTRKQRVTWQYLHSKKEDNISEVLYGGGAGGGKTFLGCLWIMTWAKKYPGTRYFIGRKHIVDLLGSTLTTFNDLISLFKYRKFVKYSNNKYTFINGSEIFTAPMKFRPSDPDYDFLGGREYTGVFIDEASEVPFKSYDVLASRIRYKFPFNKETNTQMSGKLLMGSNPGKNWLYEHFYYPDNIGKLEPHKKFVKSLVTDNVYIEDGYIDRLKQRDQITQKRLLHGMWDYDDSEAFLINYDKIGKMFNNPEPKEFKQKYLTIDVARYGADKSVIILWEDLHIKFIWMFSKFSLKQFRLKIEKIAKDEDVKQRNILIDEDGIGGGLKDEMGHKVMGFMNNSTPVFERYDKKSYKNLKTQCTFKFAELVNKGKISVYSNIDQDLKDMMTKDMLHMKWKNPDDDQKVSILTKDEIKQMLGRSPDIGDALMMRSYYELISFKPTIISTDKVKHLF